ncbi:ABC transporter ATP-binding protein [Roseibium sp. LAB1]
MSLVLSMDSMQQPDTEEILLEFRNLSKSYETRGGAVLAVSNLNLQVRDGEFLTIVGPSGCGKSTLLNMLAGLERPSEGEILLRGRPVAEAQREIGYVMQNDNLYPWRTLIQNVMFPLEIRGIPARKRKAIAEEYLAKVQLDGFEDKYPYELSGGMRQRGNIVRALSFSPSLLIMDEPFGPLDAQTRLLLQMQLLELWREEKKTVIFITHDLPEAIALGDRVMVMSARPGRAKCLLDVDIPRPRDISHIHEESSYRELLTRLGDELAEEIKITVASKRGG